MPRMIRSLLVVIGLLAVVAAGALAWLYAMPLQPEPHVAEAWQLGPALPALRGEQAMAVAHAEPCPTSQCGGSAAVLMAARADLITP
jgi:hypothetical protein